MAERVHVVDCADGARRPGGAQFTQVAIPVTANINLTPANASKFYTNRGAVGAVTMNLPAAARGLRFFVALEAPQGLTVAATGGAKINGGVANGNITAAGTQAGFGVAEIFCFDGVNWAVDMAGTWSTT